jgi:multiple antibiotic resistance protein
MWTFLAAVPMAFLALLPVINPIGTALVLASFTGGVEREVRVALAWRVAVNTVALLTAILLCGRYLLSFFGISVPIVQFAGGIVLAALGWRLLNQPGSEEAPSPASPSPAGSADLLSRAFYPFTFPITVGPGAIAVTLTLTAHLSRRTLVSTLLMQAGILVGIIANAVLVYLCLAYSNRVVSRLGPSGTAIVLRLVAFFVLCIGVQISWEGLSSLLAASGVTHPGSRVL